MNSQSDYLRLPLTARPLSSKKKPAISDEGGKTPRLQLWLRLRNMLRLRFRVRQRGRACDE